MSTALATRHVAKPWGRLNLPPPFESDQAEPIGEIWFEPPPALDELLVKYIFTSENLSVQVHPSDNQTAAKGLGRRGKEECWLVIDAVPGAKLAIGFTAPIGPAAMHAAALDGSIEQLLAWHPVSVGDFFYVPANTVHAIGAGVSLIEVQQNSDITYRLYDYGRPRELHLKEGIAVASGGVYAMDRWHQHIDGLTSEALVNGPYFRLDHVAGRPDASLSARYLGRHLLVVPLVGNAVIRDNVIAPGACGLAESIQDVVFDSSGRCLIEQTT